MSRSLLARIAARLLGKAPSSEPRQAPPRTDGPEEWCVGDLAECICPSNGHFGWYSLYHPFDVSGPAYGDVRRVVDIVDDCDGLFIAFSPWPKSCFAARHFRKVTPRADEQTAGSCATISDLMRLPAQPAEAA